MPSSYGTGRYAPSSLTEGDALMYPRTHSPRSGGTPGQRIGVVYMHGYGELSHGVLGLTGFNEAALVRAIADVYPVVSCDLGIASQGGTSDANGWGNTNAQARIDDAIAWLQSPLGGGAKPGKVHLFGISMGHASSMNYAQAKPWKVASISAILPVNDTDDIRDNNRGGVYLRQSISTAYAAGGQHSYANCGLTLGSATVTTASVIAGDNGMFISGPGLPINALLYVGTVTAGTSFLLSSAPTSQVNVNALQTLSAQTLFFTPRWTANGTPALPAGANPALTANQTNLLNIPQKLWYANDDTVCVPATISALQTNIPNITTVNLGNVGGHSDTTLSFVSTTDLLAFLAAAS